MLRRVCLAFLLLLLAAAPPALAQVGGAPPPGYNGPPINRGAPPPGFNAQPLYRRAPPPGFNAQPLDRILPGIRNGRAGQFSDAEGPFPDGAGGWRYRIKWLTPDGRIVWLDTDARTGRVIGPSRAFPGMMMPPAGLRYYPFAPGPHGMGGRFGGGRRGGWRPGGWRPGGRWR